MSGQNASKSNAATILRVKDLKTQFFTDDGVVRAVDGVSFSIGKEQVLGVVGESGCGKSMMGLSLLQLVPKPGRIVDGAITYYGNDQARGIDIASLKPDSEAVRRVRGKEIAMVFQEPMTSLSPIYTIGQQIEEALRMHQRVSRQESHDIAVEILDKVGLPDPGQRFHDYPFQLSGGMRQRALVAIALVNNPKLLIADEPTTALDVTVQAQILRLLRSLQHENDMSIMFISHDLGVIARMADEVIVMYLGKVLERGAVRDVFNKPQNPYTIGLMASIPRLGTHQDLTPISGSVPSSFEVAQGCRFMNRCPYAMEACQEEPPEFDLGDGHTSRCWLNEGGATHNRGIETISQRNKRSG